eukprot:CAMPEP_0172541974 /NCGR_PEP_ID=MMETSP1067-20121228/12673_1 /TAXON_ID=265564 ORGANISM="Thalassiosira punctigera, Strain Tpunct2005C2" /NCGR_SAMPLE_ID=MMETSP1067 /ASSEMBLY_ACC=CAM_ASM_000444 /LENGTH=267 /DNA_ID=CAMNT_0013328113 /DNA_START=97 /DNA_END=897 /DNA_ORIENTATION=-
MLPLLITLFALLIPGYNGFTAHPSNKRTSLAAPTPPKSVLTKLNGLPDSVQSFEDARGYFYLWFFGGSGGVGVALRQFPLQFQKFRELAAMSDKGPTRGGDAIGISPLCLYPRDLSRADLDEVLNNKMSVEQMVERGPKPNYLSEKGYLCFQSFAAANEGCNPLTLRAVFDAMSTGDNVSPDVAQANLDEFSSDGSADRASFKNALLKTKLTGFSSIAFLLFLLGPIVGSTCLDALSAGWFPDWPGNGNLPWSLLVGPGVWTIPKYW